MKTPPFRSIVEFCESQLAQHGDTPEGVGWKLADGDVRYQVMLELIRSPSIPCSLLDFGCGASHLLDYMLRTGVEGIEYHGLDVSARFIELSRSKHPSVPYYMADVLDPTTPELPTFDYVVMNGLLTYKGPLSFEEMYDYALKLLAALFPLARQGLAFNAMSTRVEWTRDDLFHLPVDRVLNWLSRNLSRHLVVRHDYGLYEYTVYVYRDPSGPQRSGVKRLIETN